MNTEQRSTCRASGTSIAVWCSCSLFLPAVWPAPGIVHAADHYAVAFRDYGDGPLTAHDFQAPAPNLFDAMGGQALTTADLTYDLKYRLHSTRQGIIVRLSWIRIRAVVIPNRSWNRTPANTRLMDHEQGHFDLAYIAALRARLDFPALRRLVGKGDNQQVAIESLRQQIDSHFRQLLGKLGKAQVAYDRVTCHGEITVAQDEQRESHKREIASLIRQMKKAGLQY